MYILHWMFTRGLLMSAFHGWGNWGIEKPITRSDCTASFWTQTRQSVQLTVSSDKVYVKCLEQCLAIATVRISNSSVILQPAKFGMSLFNRLDLTLILSLQDGGCMQETKLQCKVVTHLYLGSPLPGGETSLSKLLYPQASETDLF